MTASFPAVRYGPLHFRLIDMEKACVLQHAKENVDMCMQLTDPSLASVKLYRDSVHSAYNFVRHGQPEVIIFTNAPSYGWGLFCAAPHLKVFGAQVKRLSASITFRC